MITEIRVRAVRGRVVDPFRGGMEDGPERLANRDADTQPFADVLAAIENIALVRVERAGRRLALERGDERLKVAFVSGAPRVGLDDLVLEGDGRLALAVMHALLPWFGPVEIRIGQFEALVDGHDPAAKLVETYDAWFVDDSLRVADTLDQRDAAEQQARAARQAQPVRPRRTKSVAKRTSTWLLAGLLFLIVFGIATLPRLIDRWVRSDLGEACDNGRDCRSEYCLPRATASTGLFQKLPTDMHGVCTQRCSDDSGCPASMECRELLETDYFSVTGKTRGCVPRAWHDER